MRSTLFALVAFAAALVEAKRLSGGDFTNLQDPNPLRSIVQIDASGLITKNGIQFIADGAIDALGLVQAGFCFEVDITKNGINVAGVEYIQSGKYHLDLGQAADLTTCGGSVNAVFNQYGGSGVCACKGDFNSLLQHNVCKGPIHADFGVAACDGGACKVACKRGFVPTPDGLDCACESGKSILKDSCGRTSCVVKPPVGPSQRAKSKAKREHARLGVHKRSAGYLQCAAPETACLIDGGIGGYECVDTQSHLESCGGCLGEGGVDCTKIKGASSVGCAAGSCVVFSCKDEYSFDSNGSCSDI